MATYLTIGIQSNGQLNGDSWGSVLEQALQIPLYVVRGEWMGNREDPG
jgi:hypothetical protein